MTRYVLIAFVLVFWATFSVQNTFPVTKLVSSLNKHRISGSEANEDFAYTVGLKSKNSIGSPPACGGAIISPRHVITEAWCIEIIPDLIIMAGCIDYDGDCDTYEIDQIIYHPEIGDIGINDIAIIVTMEEIVMSELVKMVSITPQYIEANTMANISGWVSFSTSEMAYTEVEIIDDESCERTWGVSGGANLCTIPNTEIGWGDWGCPLVVDGLLVAFPVNSMYPSTLHMRLSHYFDYIQDVLDSTKT